VADLLALDVNETLLDLAVLDPVFERAFGDAALRRQWFGDMLQLVFVAGMAGQYLDFPSAQRAALVMVARRAGVEAEPGVGTEIAETMRSLPAHPEVPDALRLLRDQGRRLVALTNSPVEVAEAQLTSAGLRDLVDAVHSGDEVRQLKPGPAPYRHVAERERVDISQVRLVAAHSWDVTGALAVGAKAAFVARPGMVLSPLVQPDVIGADLAEVATLILERG